MRFAAALLAVSGFRRRASFGFSQAQIGLLLCLCLTVVVSAEEQQSKRDERFFSLPMELEFDSGATNGDATILKFVPLYKISLNEDWSLINLNLIVLADAPGGIPGLPGNPSPTTSGDRTLGLGDLTHLSFFTPKTTDDFIYGIGFLATLPIATDSTLGSQKWSAGPAFRVTYRQGPWNLGLVGGNLWSYAGEGDRADVNQLMLRGAIRRTLTDGWYLVSAPVITTNWKGKSGQKWLLPLGGGIGKRVGRGSSPWALSLQAYANVIKPDAAPDWMIRFGIVAAIPESFLEE
jgi:hypothetical protein